ncbi:hypothetical protein C5Y97_05615 [Blastopirellula marina]|uniref:Uncharacterized protein n=1 Tax=Blastopirellula marina TaxID=124 RepID=A0A2S8G8B7_9BACT|nr:hypothetical protein C5Y98_05615 [Blastopirellula marina]PTL45656.1 hypothetical protein C5Y97_05615 [Blastopirellula marina]
MFKFSLIVAATLALAGCSSSNDDRAKSENGGEEVASEVKGERKPRKPTIPSGPIVNASPQECFERMIAATEVKDVVTLLACFATEDRNRNVGMVAFQVERLVFFQTDQKDQALALLTKYHLEKTDIMGMMQIFDSPGGQGAAKAVEIVGSQVKDQTAFMQEAADLLNPDLKDESEVAAKQPQTTKLADVKVEGDFAEGTLKNKELDRDEPIYFVKENGSWVVTANPPEMETPPGKVSEDKLVD